MPSRRTVPGLALGLVLAAMLLAAALPALRQASTAGSPGTLAEATSTPDPSTGSTVPSILDPSASPTPAPPSVPDSTATATPATMVSPSPRAPSSAPIATPAPTPTPTPVRTPAPTRASIASSVNLFRTAGFRYQDPNYTACTSTAVMDILNFIALDRHGGAGFRWRVNLTGTERDTILAWERRHDTLAASSPGSDANGMRNALNHYGWGDTTLYPGHRVYQDMAFATFGDAIHTAVRQLILTGKPVVVIAWAGKHAQVMTGYAGLVGNPLAKKADGTWANAFSVSGIYLSDPLRADGWRIGRISLAAFASSPNLHLRFRRFLETDSPFDDPYTPGQVPSRDTWLHRFVLVVPVR